MTREVEATREDRAVAIHQATRRCSRCGQPNADQYVYGPMTDPYHRKVSDLCAACIATLRREYPHVVFLATC